MGMVKCGRKMIVTPSRRYNVHLTKHRTLTHSCEPLNFHKKTQQIFTRWAPTIVINGVPTPISRVMLPIYVRPEKKGPHNSRKIFSNRRRRRTWARGQKSIPIDEWKLREITLQPIRIWTMTSQLGSYSSECYIPEILTAEKCLLQLWHPVGEDNPPI